MAVALALTIKAVFSSFIEGGSSFLLLSVAVLAGAIFGGFGPAVLATLLGAVVASYLYLPPAEALMPATSADFTGLLLFLVQGFAISGIGAALATTMRRAGSSAQRAAEDRDSLRASEERYRLLVESVKDYSVFSLSLDGLISDWNPGAELLFGYREDEIVGRHFSVLFTPEDVRRGAPAGELEQARLEERGEDERWHLRKDGSRFWSSGFVRPLRDASGELRGFSKVARDVTERKRAYDALHTSESRLAEAQRMARLGNWEYDVGSDEAYWSEELYRIFGFEPREFVPNYRTFLRLVHPGDRPILREAVRNAASGAPRSSVEYRIVRPDGEVRAVSTEYEPVMDGSGRMVSLVGTIQDVTERRQADEALRESEERYRIVAETASDAIIVIDEDGRISFVNEAAGSTFGYSRDEMLGETLTMLMPEHMRELHQSAFQRHLDTGERRLNWRSVQLPGLHKSGREVSLELSFGSFVRDGRRFFTGFIRDITERKRLQEQLQISEERFRSIIEQSPLSVQVLSPDGTTLRVNRAWEDLWGATFEQITSSGYNMLEDRQLAEKGIMPYIRRGFAGEPTAIPPIMYDPDETLPGLSAHETSQRWVSGFIYPVRDEAGDMREVTLIHEDITERVLAEEALRESEGRFRSTFEQAAVGMAHVGFGGEWLRVNDKLCEITGYTREELLGLTFQDLTHPEDIQGDEEAFRRLQAGEIDSYSREKRYRRKDGSIVWIDLTVTIGEDASGRQDYTISVIEDITGRKHVEEELVRLASYPRLNPNPIVEVDARGALTYLNPAAAEMFPGLEDSESWHPLLEGLAEAAPGARETGASTAVSEVRVGGRSYHRTVFRVPGSGLLRIYAMDITERHRSEEALRRSEERYRAVIEQMAEGIFMFDPGTKEFVESNTAFGRMFGYTEDELRSMKLYDLVAHDPESVEANVRRNLDEGRLYIGERRYRHSDGSILEVEVSGSVISYGEDREVVCAIVRDVTERKKAEKRSRFLAELSRALQPLTDPDEIMAVTARMLGEHLEVDRCAYAEVEEDEDHLTVTGGYTRGVESIVGRFAMSDFGDEALRLMRANEPYVVVDSETDERVSAENLPMYRQTQIRAVVCIPLRRAGRFVARMDVHQKTPRRWSEEEVELITTVVNRCRESTERARAIRSLSQSEALYRAVVEQAAENIFLVDAETGRIMEYNAALQNSLGYTAEELSLMTIYELVDSDRESVERNTRRVLEQGSYFIGERAYLRKDGSPIPVEVGVSAISREGRQTLCVVAHDVEERKRSEEALQEVRQAERSRIARELHDNVLQELIYALQEAQILEVFSEQEQVGEIAESLRRSVEGIRSAVFELRLEETLGESFVASVRAMVDLHRRMARHRHRVELEVDGDFPQSLPPGAAQGLIRIVQEALSNARRHSEARLVQVLLQVECGFVRAEVCDDGKGFDPEFSESGVGWYSMRQRAEQIGGELWVDSAPGSGTRVLLRLPAASLMEG